MNEGGVTNLESGNSNSSAPVVYPAFLVRMTDFDNAKGAERDVTAF